MNDMRMGSMEIGESGCSHAHAHMKSERTMMRGSMLGCLSSSAINTMSFQPSKAHRAPMSAGPRPERLLPRNAPLPRFSLAISRPSGVERDTPAAAMMIASRMAFVDVSKFWTELDSRIPEQFRAVRARTLPTASGEGSTKGFSRGVCDWKRNHNSWSDGAFKSRSRIEQDGRINSQGVAPRALTRRSESETGCPGYRSAAAYRANVTERMARAPGLMTMNIVAE